MNNAGINEKDATDQMKSMNLDSLKGALDQGMKEFNKINNDSMDKVMKDAMKELEKLKEVQKEN